MTTTIDKQTRVTRFNPEAQLFAKVDGDGNGHIEGYAAVFGNVDLQDEVIRKGAFAKTLNDRVPAGKVKLMVRHWAHGGDTLEVIGTVTEAKEDDNGLWIHAELSGLPLAQNTRQLIVEGHVSGLSVGYNVIDFGFTEIDGRSVTELREIRLLEVTVTSHPANESAVITAAKAADHTTKPEAAPASSSDRVAPTAQDGKTHDPTSEQLAEVDAMAAEVAGNEVYLRTLEQEL